MRGGGRGYPADPGGAALVAVLIFAFVPLIAFAVRRRWRMAEERREEVRRLLRLAAAEAERAEIEAVAEYAAAAQPVVVPALLVPGAADGGEGRMLCAVCSSPKTTRCSRCKAVRYCSGRCQIIHWRQGHKDGCHPQQIDVISNRAKNVEDLEGEVTEQSNLWGKSLDIRRKPLVKLEEKEPNRKSAESNLLSVAFSEDDNHGISTSMNASKANITCNSSTDSSLLSSCSTVSDPSESSHVTSACEDPCTCQNGNLEEPCPFAVPSDCPRKEIDESMMNRTRVLGSEFPNTGFPSTDVSRMNSFKQKGSGYKPEDVGSRLSSRFGSGVITDTCVDAQASKKIDGCQEAVLGSCGVPSVGVASIPNSQFSGKGDQIGSDTGSPPYPHSAPQSSFANRSTLCRASSAEASAQLDLKNSIAFCYDNSGSVAKGSSNSVFSTKPKNLSLQSSLSSSDYASSDHGYSASVTNGISDLKTSVRRVVQQFKSAPVLSHYPTAFINDIPGKCEMLFPYDLFIKLYNCDKLELRPCGLVNCGNSCYANAVLQCLAFTCPLTAYLLQRFHSKSCTKQEWCFTCEFESLLMKIKGQETPLSPIGIISHIRNIGSNLDYGREEDAHEFLRCAIDAMQSVCLKESGASPVGSVAEETTLIQLTFGGYLLSQIKCMRCRGKSEQRERMMDLTVEIYGDIRTLEEALARFTATEILDGENKYHCNRCKSYERAKKKLTVLEAPNILTIALKRFQSGKFGKLNKAIRFPEYLDLAPYMSGMDDKSPVYRLYAVVVHLDIMNAAFSGHYICYVKSTQKKWYKIDDSKVKPVEFESVLSKNGYMLFYARCSPHAPSVIRKGIPREHVKYKDKCKEAVQSGHSPEAHASRARPATIPPPSSSEGGNHVDPNLPAEHSKIFRPVGLLHKRIRYHDTDSSSDSSSLLSCSDEGSWSTESSRNSTSTDDFSARIFGDSGRFSCSSSSSFCEDSDGHAYSQLFSRHAAEAVRNGQWSNAPNGRSWASDLRSSDRDEASQAKGLCYEDRRPFESKGLSSQGRGCSPHLYSDPINQHRKLTEECRSRESDSVERHKLKSSMLSRRCTTREKTDQACY